MALEARSVTSVKRFATPSAVDPRAVVSLDELVGHTQRAVPAEQLPQRSRECDILRRFLVHGRHERHVRNAHVITRDRSDRE
jgi:hypothetical protein